MEFYVRVSIYRGYILGVKDIALEDIDSIEEANDMLQEEIDKIEKGQHCDVMVDEVCDGDGNDVEYDILDNGKYYIKEK